MKKISIVIPCFNEEENIDDLYARIKNEIDKNSDYKFEIIFIDNASSDETVSKIRRIAHNNTQIKAILNNRNFGHIRSPYWGMMQANGDAIILMAADLQEPPELITKFLKEWELGWKVVLAIKPSSQTGLLMHNLRKIYYRILDSIADVNIVKDATGFGLYDKIVINKLREINDPNPFVRGLLCEIGYPIKTIPFDQQKRAAGKSKNNLYILYDIAMLGIVSHSLVPIRVASFIGFLVAMISFIIALFYFIFKLLYWDQIPLGIAPMMIGQFFMFGLVLILIGMLGEYIGSIHNYVKNRPIVVEKERINFD